MIPARLSVQFENLHAVDPAALDLEAQGGADHMETLDPGCSRIYHQHIPLRVTYDLQDMGMAAYEYVRPVFVDEIARAVRDYCDINPEFGTLEDFDRFVAEAHKLGLRVIIDWVANHTSPDAVWVRGP